MNDFEHFTDQGSEYFTDREYGSCPATHDVIDERLWGSFYSLIKTRIKNGAFGWRFPEQCPDGNVACGCDSEDFERVLCAEIPQIEWPLSPSKVPDTPVILDLLEFCARAVGEPIQVKYHDFFSHHHLSWDQHLGFCKFVEEVNLLFRRNAVAFELTSTGQARRTHPQPLSDALFKAFFRTHDPETDRLLEAARNRFFSPKKDDRQDALEKLWDAFERLKTLEPGAEKKHQAKALLNRVASVDTEFRQVLEREAKELTDIGNRFRIRHSETTQEILTSSDQLDYLFARMFAFIYLILRKTGRVGPS